MPSKTVQADNSTKLRLEIGSQQESLGKSIQWTPATVKLCTHQQRRAYMLKACNDMKRNIPWQKLRFLCDAKRKLLYCEISKSGCTTWKALWKHANNPELSLKAYSENPKLVHKVNKYYRSGLELETEALPSSITESYTKFIVVRHPFSRLLSGFNNIKYRTAMDPGPSPSLMQHLSEKFNLSFDGSIPDLTMTNFLQFVTDENIAEQYYHDRHFEPFSHSCAMCNMSYDYILRLETSSLDTEPVLSLLGYGKNFISKNISINSKQDRFEEVMGSRYIKEFMDVPHELVDKLMERYYFDLKLFGYHYNRDTMQAECAIKTGDGDICC